MNTANPDNPPNEIPLLRVILLIIGLWIAFTFLTILYFYLGYVLRFQSVGITIRTKVELNNLGTATKSFEKHFNRWPTNLSELKTNSANMWFVDHSLSDRWNRPYIYQPPTNNTPGKIGTYGVDGLPNGDKSDGDHFVAF